MPESTLNFEIIGDGVPVIFLHGFMESKSMWSTIGLNYLPFKSILIDLPGHGKSSLDSADKEPSILFYVQKVKEVVDVLGLDYYSVVGHSMGGYVALGIKDLDPRCKKVVLLHSNFWADSESKKRDRIRLADFAFKSKELLIREAIPGLFYRFKSSDPSIKALISEALEMTPEAIAYASLAMRMRPDKSALLERKSVDFCIIQGANDPLVSNELMKEHLKNKIVRYELLPDAGHMGHIEVPDSITKILHSFLN